MSQENVILIAIGSQKGGVSKITVAINVWIQMCRDGKRVPTSSTYIVLLITKLIHVEGW